MLASCCPMPIIDILQVLLTDLPFTWTCSDHGIVVICLNGIDLNHCNKDLDVCETLEYRCIPVIATGPPPHSS